MKQEYMDAEEFGEYDKDIANVMAALVVKMVTVADKHDVDRDSAIQHFARVFSAAANVCTFAKYSVRDKMKKVYICSPYRADGQHTVEDNIKTALHACRYAAKVGFAPYAPHLYLPQCLNDNDPAERRAGLIIGQEFLAMCDEVWQWGETISEGMAAELALARQLNIPIKVFKRKGQKL